MANLHTSGITELSKLNFTQKSSSPKAVDFSEIQPCAEQSRLFTTLKKTFENIVRNAEKRWRECLEKRPYSNPKARSAVTRIEKRAWLKALFCGVRWPLSRNGVNNQLLKGYSPSPNT